MYKLAFFVPESHLEHVKAAVFAAGAGRVRNYDQCCWQVLGIGQFRPCMDSTPLIGDIEQLEKVPEYRVEMVCSDEHITAAVAALRSAHPYEEPAIDVWQLAELSL
ncbi:MAG: NGG1p interacting factor NIF3 [Sphingobacteriales bacterium]|nr:MAG: NGG1p interacting factor NIF3 [Sphingobacteriales bacterium]